MKVCKILPFFLLAFGFLSSAFGASEPDTYIFQVDNPVMVDAYYNIFNAMVGLFKSDGYMLVLKLVFLIGGIITFYIGVIKSGEDGSHRGMFHFGKYLVAGTLILTALGLGGENGNGGDVRNGKTLLIVSKEVNGYCKEAFSSPNANGSANVYNTTGSTSPTTTDTYGVQVSNVPAAAAWGFSFFNQLGTKMSDMAKVAFGPIDGQTGQGSYGNLSDYAAYLQNIKAILSTPIEDFSADTKVGESMREAGFNPDNLKTIKALNLSGVAEAVINQCVYIPASSDDNVGPLINYTFTNTGYIKKTLEDYKNGSLMLYVSPGIDDAQQPQGRLIANNILINGQTAPADLLANVHGKIFKCGDLIDDFLYILSYMEKSNAILCIPQLKNLDQKTMAILTGSIFTGQIPSEPKTKEIILNAALANQVFDAKSNIALGEIPYATGKSMSEFVMSSLGTGYYMSKMIPYIQMGMRAILYAFFPFVFIVVLLPGGIKVLTNYLQTMLWIELWIPTAIILDMFLSYMSSNEFKSMFQESGFNYLNAVQSFSDAAMLSSVAGFLYASVPALTWLILKGSGYMLGNITGSVGAIMAKNMDSDVVDMDRKEILEKNEVNRMRKLQGLNEIGIAEIRKRRSMMVGKQAAGLFLAMDAIDKSDGNALAEISSGHVKATAAGGLASNEAMQTTEDIKDVSKKKEFDVTTEKEIGKSLQEMSEKDREELAKNVATGNLSQLKGKEAFVKDIARAIGADLSVKEGRKAVADYIAHAHGYSASVETQTQNKVSKQIDSDEHSSIGSVKTVADLEESKSKLNEISHMVGGGDVIDKDGNINKENAAKMLEAMEKSGMYNAAQIAAVKKVVDTAGTGRISSATTQKMISQIGADSNRGKQFAEKAKVWASGLSGEKRRKMLEMANAAQKGDLKAIMTLAGIDKIMGAKSEAWNQQVGDKTVDAVRRAGYNQDDIAAMRAGQSSRGVEEMNVLAGRFVDVNEEVAYEHKFVHGLVKENGKALSEKEYEELKEYLAQAGIEMSVGELKNLTPLDMEKNQKLKDTLSVLNARARTVKDLSYGERRILGQKIRGAIEGDIESYSKTASKEQVEAYIASYGGDIKAAARALGSGQAAEAMRRFAALGKAFSYAVETGHAEVASNVLITQGGIQEFNNLVGMARKLKENMLALAGRDPRSRHKRLSKQSEKVLEKINDLENRFNNGSFAMNDFVNFIADRDVQRAMKMYGIK